MNLSHALENSKEFPQDVVTNVPPPPTNSVPPPPVPPQILRALARGWEVFPLQRGTKTGYFHTKCKDCSVSNSWQKQATNDIKQVLQWGSDFPGCNWGIRTGHTSGFYVIDIDSAEALQWVTAAGVPLTYLVKTGRKDGNGLQAYIRQPEGVRIKTVSDILNGAPMGLDVRGDKNGYVVAPPGLHPDGNFYELLCEGELPDAPQWLLDLVTDDRTEEPAVDISDLDPLTEGQRQHGLSILRSACQKYANVPDGQWNSELNKLAFLAGQLVARGVLTREEAELQVSATPTAEIYIAEKKSAFKATFNSGFKHGLAKPWISPQDRPEEVFEPGAPLPEGASLVPLPPTVALTPKERMIANLGTQHAIALIFADRKEGKMLYDHTRKAWLEYDGTRWVVDERKRIHHFILGIASEMNGDNKASMVTSSFCDGVNRHLQSFLEFSRTSEDFDQDHYLLNTPSGTLDLRTGKMRPHDPNDMITLCTAAAPDTESDGTAFRKFMMEITGGDEELIRFHQVSLGACLSGAVEGHWLLFWYGVPRAGKNTLGELVEGLMGDYARTIPTSTLMSKKFEGHPTEMANLQGIRLATSSELSDGDHWNEARIKQLTGDATISARWIGGNYFEFDRTFKLLVYGNYKPQLRSADEALRARLKIVPFKHSFLGREDVDLPAKLWASQGYVLQWLIEGHQQWLDAGKKLPQCPAVESEIADYFEGQSTPKLWLRECCEVLDRDDRPDLQLHTVVECYRNYKSWKEARGESALSQTRWEPEALSALRVVRTRRGKCVQKLRLLPLELPFQLSNPTKDVTTPLTPPAPVPAPPARVQTFAEFVAKINQGTPVN